jgi:hypothetical protein
MKTMIKTARWICIAVTIAMTVRISAQSWTAPAVLSTGGQGWESAAAIDGSGNSVAVWDEVLTTQSQLWSSSKASGANWGSATQVSPALETNMVFPAVKITPAGFATAVWTDESGVWTADRPTPSKWNAAENLIPGVSDPIFVMNSSGSAAIVWTEGGAPRSTSGYVMAILRPAGGSWGPQQIVASGPHIVAEHAGISESGAVVITWETYTATCRRYGCSSTSFILHASRQNTGSNSWIDSGTLMGPDLDAHNALVTLDSAGGAILLAVTSSGTYNSATQGNSGGAWSSFKTAINPQGTILISDMVSDDAGQVTLVYESISYPMSQAFAVNGSVSSNTWSSPIVLSGSDTSVGQVLFATSPGGAALVIYLSNVSTPVVRAVTRATGTGSWTAPVNISSAGSEISPEAAAVESSGNAIAIYSGYNAGSVHTEYATNFVP